MKTLLFLSTTISYILTTFTHPVSILILILLNTLLICSMSWILMKSSWVSFILFIIFLGGLMVLFVYITSLASNEKFELETKTMILAPLISMFLIMFFDNLSTNFLSNSTTSSLLNLLSPTFSFNNLIMIILIMIYLFITLLVAVKTATKYEGPLRNILKK